MPLQNRVTPLGDLVALPERGTLMGNRGGRIHDVATRTLLRRRYASRQWICCVLVYRNWRRQVMGRGYTELFFLDEVTALAAGHRPCFLCRRADALAFAAAFAAGNGLANTLRAADMDRLLHAERLQDGAKRLHGLPATLPDGAMIACGDEVFARRKGNWLRWSPKGYARGDPDAAAARLVTPPSIVSALAAGYRPRWHASAAGPV